MGPLLQGYVFPPRFGSPPHIIIPRDICSPTQISLIAAVGSVSPGWMAYRYMYSVHGLRLNISYDLLSYITQG